ncbi:hypothetical protein Tco_0742954 [Tanacetum coccineum]
MVVPLEDSVDFSILDGSTSLPVYLPFNPWSGPVGGSSSLSASFWLFFFNLSATPLLHASSPQVLTHEKHDIVFCLEFCSNDLFLVMVSNKNVSEAPYKEHHLDLFQVRVVESVAVVVEVVDSVVVGVGICVDCYGRVMNGGIGRGMVVTGADEVSWIIVRGTVRIGEGLKYLDLHVGL